VPSLIVLDEKFLQSQALGSSFIMLTEMQATPIILLTADLKSIQYESGAGEKKNYRYLRKPCQITKLKQAVKKLRHISKLPV
jgi:CheY-like chemotaxis protein